MTFSKLGQNASDLLMMFRDRNTVESSENRIRNLVKVSQYITWETNESQKSIDYFWNL